jgi:hypothetical protein
MPGYDELVEVVGKDCAEAIRARFGGTSLYIPKHGAGQWRDESIRSGFVEELHHGATCMGAYRSLADEYGLSVRRVQAVVAGK